MTRTAVKVLVDGREITVRTNARTVLSALRDAHIQVDPADRVLPGRYVPVESGLVVRVERALPVQVAVDGAEVSLRTQAATVGDLLSEAGVALAAADVVLLRGAAVDLASPLVEPSPAPLLASSDGALARARPPSREAQRGGDGAAGQPARLTVKRAVPLVVHDAGLATTIYTAAETVGDALRGAGINVYLADRVRPDVGTPVQADLHVFVERSKLVTIICDDPEIAPGGSFVTRSLRQTVREVLADEGIALSGREEITPSLDAPVRHGMEVSIRRFHPVSIAVDGRLVETKTKKDTIQEVLAEEGIPLGPLDRVSPPLEATPLDGTAIVVVRVREVIEEETEAIPFESLGWRANPEIELDTTAYQAGEPGLLKRKLNVVYENGLPVQKTVLEEWVEKEPVPEVNYYGTKVVIRELETPQGTVQYWRKINVLATYYHDSSSGKAPGDPTWGITRTGTRTRKGVVATDPNLIPLWTQMYIPGYGIAVAEDTGGGIKGKHIDVWLPEGESWWGVRWPTIYLLTPVPDWYPARLP